MLQIEADTDNRSQVVGCWAAHHCAVFVVSITLSIIMPTATSLILLQAECVFDKRMERRIGIYCTCTQESTRLARQKMRPQKE